MSFKDCIVKAAADGKIKPEKAKEAEIIYDAFYAKSIASGADEYTADMAAGLESMEYFTKKTSVDKVRKMREMQKSLQFSREIDGIKPEDLPRWLKDFHDKKVQAAYTVRAREMSSIMEELEYEFRPRFLGLSQLLPHHRKSWVPFKNKRDLDDIVRALYKEATSLKNNEQKSKLFSELINKMTLTTVRHANRFGVDMGWHETFRLPQRRARNKMRKRKDEWVKDHLDASDWDKMVHVSGPKEGLPIAVDERVAFLNDSYDIIITDGMDKRGIKIADAFSLERSIHYKDADSWIKMNDKYGDGTVLTQLVGFMDGMSRNLALVDVFGPNPDSMVRSIKDGVYKKTAAFDKANQDYSLGTKANGAIESFDAAHSIFTNENSASYESWPSMLLSTSKNIIYSSLLGGVSLLSVPTDIGKGVHRALWTGTSPGRFIGQYADFLASTKSRREVTRAEFILDSGMGMTADSARFSRDMGGARWSRLFSDAAFRLSFLTPTTKFAKAANSVAVLHALTEARGVKFDDLQYKGLLTEAGITEREWDIFRSTQGRNEHLGIIDYPSIRSRTDIPWEVAQDVADKFAVSLVNEVRKRVMEGGLRGRAFLTGKSAPDSFAGMAASAISMLKGYPVAMFAETLDDFAKRSSSQGGGGKGKAVATAEVVTMFAAMTLMGALATQLKQIKSGRDPLDMTTQEFWGMASLAGGGASFLGDFLFSNLNDFGQSTADYFFGPLGDFSSKLKNLTVGNLVEILNGDETNAAKEFFDFAATYTPFSKTWWFQLPLERMITERLSMEVSPEAYRNYMKRNRKRLKDYGQKMWWPHGQDEPARAPDLEAALGE